MRAFLIFCALLPVVLDAYTNTQLQLVAAASESASASYTAKGAVPATGGIVAQSSSYTHYSGDAAAYVLQPAAQHNGVAYEWLADNDGDLLSDTIEAAIGSDLYAADTDADGLTDGQEYLVHGTSVFDVDSDADGVWDADEVLAGTNPLDASNRFVVHLQAAEDGRLGLEWNGVVGRSYTIESSSSLEGPWSGMHGGTATLTVEFDPDLAVDQAFYRVIID